MSEHPAGQRDDKEELCNGGSRSAGVVRRCLYMSSRGGLCLQRRFRSAGDARQRLPKHAAPLATEVQECRRCQ